MFRYNLPFFRIIFIYHVYHDKRYLKMTCMKTPCTFGDLFLLGRNVKEVTFFNAGYIPYERGTFSVKMIHHWVRGWIMGRPGNV